MLGTTRQGLSIHYPITALDSRGGDTFLLMWQMSDFGTPGKMEDSALGTD